MRYLTLLLCAALAAPACVVKTSTDVDVLTTSSVSGPSATGSPSPTPCDVASLDLGTVGDVTTVVRGGEALELVLSYRGAQGIELPESCSGAVRPEWTVSGPCTLEGNDTRPKVRAPATAAVGATCVPRAVVRGLADSVALTVVAGS